MNKKFNAYLLGGGIGSLAAAAFMIPDGSISGENIVILEVKPILGGSMDGTGNSIDLVKSDVKYRFVIDMASLKQAA